MAKKRLRVALIGCGQNMVGAHIPRVVEDGSVDVVALADPDPNSTRRAMEALEQEVLSFTDWERALEVPADAVLISTPHAVHFPQVRAALEAGRHVLVEKPLTLSARHSRTLIDLAESRERILVVAYQRHFMREYAYAREVVESGRLGTLQGVVGYVTQTPVARVGWRLDVDHAGGGMFADTGSHLVAATLWLTGLAPRWVQATIDKQNDDVDVNAHVHIGFATGAVGSLSTLGNAGSHDERLVIVGDRARLSFHLREWRLRAVEVDGSPLHVPKRIEGETPDAALFRWIRSAGRGYRSPEYAHRTVKVTEAVYRAAREGRAVRLRP